MAKLLRIAWPLVLLLFFACGQKDEPKTEGRKDKLGQAVEEAITKDFTLYGGAKKNLEKVEKQAQEREDSEKEAD